MGDFLMGSENGPPSQMNYKRAILKPAPREFTIETLTPVKHGGNYSYGVRVCPISRPISDSRSISSRASNNTEYEIWRRWEDCLYFQDILESEYEQLSRHKVRVLKRGGKKRDTESIYSQSKAASSFDSLPEGPDPREIALNVHDLIPPLNKKGTLFRPSRATIEQRGAEFAAMMHGLFNPDPNAPVLLRELRNSQAVRDFFGYWRRDKDTAEKYGLKMIHSNRSLSSIIPLPGQECPPLPSPASTASPPQTPITPAPMTEAARIKHYATATALSHPQSTPQPRGDPASTPPSLVQPVIRKSSAASSFNPPRFLQPESVMTFTDKLLRDETVDSAHTSDSLRGDNSSNHSSTPINGDMEYRSHSRFPQQSPPPIPHPSTRPPNAGTSEPTHATLRPRSNSSVASGYRSAYAHGTELHNMPVRGFEGQAAQQQQQQQPPPLHTFSSHPSLRDRNDRTLKSAPSSSNFSQTASSISSRFSNMSLNRSSVHSSTSGYTHASKSSRRTDFYEDDLEYDDISAAFPSPPLSSYRTPLSNIDEGRPTPSSHGGYRDYRASITSVRTEASADGVLPPHLREAWGIDDGAKEPDSYFESYSTQRVNGLPPQARKSFRRDSNQRYSGSSYSSSSSFGSTGEKGDTVAVKAAYHDHIVMFRTDRSSTLLDIRQRIKERLALHESVPIRTSFALAYVPSWSSSGQRVRGSLSIPVTSSDNLRLLQNDQDWQTALLTCNSMVRIRVLDPEALPRYI